MLASCGGSDIQQRLDHADSLMEDQPDSALAILQTIDSIKLTSEKLRARHALLNTQARVKNNLLDMSDTAALPLLVFFQENGNDFDRMRAAFYKAEIYSTLNNSQKQLKNLLYAENLASEIQDNYWLAKIYEKLADIYHTNHYYSKAADFRYNAIDCYKKAGKYRNEKFAKLDLGLDLHGCRQSSKAISLIDSIIGSVAYTDDPTLYLYGLDYKIFVITDLGELKESRACIDLKNQVFGREYSNSFNDFYYDLLLRIKAGEHVDSIELAYLKNSICSNDDFARYYWLLTEYYCNSGQPDKIQIAIDSVRKYYNEVTYCVLQQSIMSEQLNYKDELLENAKIESRNRIYFAVAIAIVLIFCAIIYFWIARTRNLKKDNTIHEIQNEITRLKQFTDNEINKLENTNASLTEQITEEQNHSKILQAKIDKNSDNPERQQYISLLKSNTILWEHTSNICTSYFNSPDTEVKSIKYRKVMRSMSTLGTPDNLQTLVTGINFLHGNVLTVMQKNYAMISQEDIYMFALLYAGASMRIISLILDRNLSTLYSRKDSILNTIRMSSSDEKQNILIFLDSLRAGSTIK